MNALLKLMIAKKVIPLQKCPICSGSGYELVDIGGFIEQHVCSVCKGKKIIPMHLINEKEHIDNIQKTLL